MIALALASAVAGVALAFAVAATGIAALMGLVAFVIVETCIVLDLLGFTPGDLR